MSRREIPPDSLLRSRSGRIPQWVLDEAFGKPVTPVPFRGPTGPTRTPRSGARKALKVVLVLMLLAVAGGVIVRFPLDGFPSLRADGSGPQGSASAPPAGHEEQAAPIGAPPSVPVLPEGEAYRLAAHQRGGSDPVTWSPCRPIHYVVRPANQPAGGAEILATAIAAVSAATGLQFINDGATDEVPSFEREPFQPDRYGDRWAPVLIAWATPAEMPDFGVDIAGEAGPVRLTAPTGDTTYVSGSVYFDAAEIDELLLAGNSAVVRAIAMHELGHLVGLAHTTDPQAIMFPRASGQVTDFGPGDRAGLAVLGTGECQPQI